jgi:hypothetical protein
LAASGGPFSRFGGFGGFGNHVGLSADGATALIAGANEAWVFTRSGSTWAQQAGPKLKGTGGRGANAFESAALSGDGTTAFIAGVRAADTRDPRSASWVFVPTASDQFGDWFALYSPNIQLASCTSEQVIASLTVPYSSRHLPHYTNGLFWVDYYGTPFAISPRFALPERGLSARGGEIPLSFAAAGLPSGNYNVHFLLWNASGQSGTLSDRTTYWGPPFPARNPDCSLASSFAAARDSSVSSSARAALATSEPSNRTVMARLRTARRRAVRAGEKPFVCLIRVPHRMISSGTGHRRAPAPGVTANSAAACISGRAARFYEALTQPRSALKHPAYAKRYQRDKRRLGKQRGGRSPSSTRPQTHPRDLAHAHRNQQFAPTGAAFRLAALFPLDSRAPGPGSPTIRWDSVGVRPANNDEGEDPCR